MEAGSTSPGGTQLHVHRGTPAPGQWSHFYKDKADGCISTNLSLSAILFLLILIYLQPGIKVLKYFLQHVTLLPNQNNNKDGGGLQSMENDCIVSM